MRGRLTVVLVAIAVLSPTAVASAQSPYPPGPFAPWDGSIPFNCTLQDAGLGPAVPDPSVDPLCVKFDKTQQNISDFGIFDFLANEPGRVAAAVPKCFYYQQDHWTGSVVQGAPPELWNWEGRYFFDKARGVGGVHLDNFRILGQPASPGAYGQVPAELAPYVDADGGGSYILLDMDADPTCVPLVDTPEERAQIYANATPPPLPTGRRPTATSAGACFNPILGNRRRNKLVGTNQGDRIVGRKGRDRLKGGAGADCLKGGNQRDKLKGGPGKDRLHCGTGFDIAVAGAGDKVSRSCERVK